MCVCVQDVQPEESSYRERLCTGKSVCARSLCAYMISFLYQKVNSLQSIKSLSFVLEIKESDCASVRVLVSGFQSGVVVVVVSSV